MNKLRPIISAVFFTVLFSISTFGQTQIAPKIMLINTEAFFDEKTGITKLVAANKKLNDEFAVQIKGLQDGSTKLQAIAQELENMRKLPPNVFNQTSFNAKQSEGETLQRQLNYNKSDLESVVSKRREILVGPINMDIGKGIDEFSRKNGYGAVFDVSKMAESGTLLFLADAANFTKEFIVFYNARPATTATATTR